MNHKKIKEKAKKILKKEFLKILIPLLIIQLINFILGYFLLKSNSSDINKITITLLINLAIAPLHFGFIAYILKFIRNKKADYKEIYMQYKDFIFIISLYFITTVLMTLGFKLYVIPGVIIYLMLSMSVYIMVDGDKEPMNCIRKSYLMTQGYKINLLLFLLSFIGWILLSILTFGILFIYTLPYILVAQAVYYEELKNLKKLD